MSAVPPGIDADRAVEIARAAIVGHVELSTPSTVKVERQGDGYVVTFVHANPPGVRGADFDARVTVDRRTGAVLELLGGS